MPVTEAIPVGRLISVPAKVLCSALWVSGRELEEARRNSAFFETPRVLRDGIEVEVDAAARRVSLQVELDRARAERLVAWYRERFPALDADWDAEARRLRALRRVRRSARFTGDQGAVLEPLDGSGLKFAPETVGSALPDPATRDWPLGDRGGRAEALVEDAADAAFADPDACTAAFLAVHRGRIVAERYAPGLGPETQLESWSMGKSVTATLIGLLVRDGRLSLDRPAPVPEWSDPGDARGAIRVADLMRMSSGLRFSGFDDPRERWEYGVPDHVRVYAEPLDVFAFSASRPPEHPPNTVGRYRNCDTLVLGSLVKRIVTEQLGASYLAWPQRALFDALGVRRQVLETDAWGNFITTGYDYGTARGWARLGLLYLADGVWDGRRLLPEGFVDFVRTPAPAWPQAEYGAQFWLNRAGAYPLPDDAYYMGGAGEQRVLIVPSLDLVVVRLGHRRGALAGARTLRRALELLVEALER